MIPFCCSWHYVRDAHACARMRACAHDLLWHLTYLRRSTAETAGEGLAGKENRDVRSEEAIRRAFERSIRASRSYAPHEAGGTAERCCGGPLVITFAMKKVSDECQPMANTPQAEMLMNVNLWRTRHKRKCDRKNGQAPMSRPKPFSSKCSWLTPEKPPLAQLRLFLR